MGRCYSGGPRAYRDHHSGKLLKSGVSVSFVDPVQEPEAGAQLYVA
jgi:hypothetical protein